jgi:hypothetical protein
VTGTQRAVTMEPMEYQRHTKAQIGRSAHAPALMRGTEPAF